MSTDKERDEGLVELTDEETAELVLTTIDNPYNPKKEYPAWRRWDVENGYFTEEYIGRLLIQETTEIYDEFVVGMAQEKVIQDILTNDTEGLYMLV